MIKTMFWLATLSTLSAHAMAEENANETEQSIEIISSAKLTQSSQAYLDPETGELTSEPTQAMIDSMSALQGAARVSQKRPPIKIITHANGMVQAELNGWFRSTITATVDCAGNIQTGHADDAVNSDSNSDIRCNDE